FVGGEEGEIDVAVLFVVESASLIERFGTMASRLRVNGGLWVAYPKKAARVATDLSFEVVQATGLGAGLVDNKACAINATWTGLRFVRRVRGRPGTSEASA